jgi:ankyrin repeat protein
MAQELRESKAEKPMPGKPKADILPSETSLSYAKEQLNVDLLNAAKTGNSEEVLKLVKAGANITAKDNRDKTALHHASQNGYAKICALLIGEYEKTGGNIRMLLDARDIWHRTPLHIAAGFGHADVCRILIMKGADVNAAKPSGTPLHEAVMGGNSSRNIIHTALVLLAAGTNPDIKRDSDYHSAWDLAQGKDVKKYIHHFIELRSMLSDDDAKGFGMNFLQCILS